MNLSSPSTVKSLLHAHNLRPNKVMGQHFLVSRRVLQQIVAVAKLTKDGTVLEVGPGLGTLTQALAERAGRVIAVEKDSSLIPVLQKNIAAYRNIEIVHGDVLKFRPQDYKLSAKSYKLVADIPYYLTSRLIRTFLESPCQPSLMVLLVQKEVARRIVAVPPHATLLSNAVQYYAEPEIVSLVPRSVFYPAPKVDSAILKLVVTHTYNRKTDKAFYALLRKAFSSPRKQILRILSGYYRKEDVARWLAEAGIPHAKRPGEIPIGKFVALAKVVRRI